MDILRAQRQCKMESPKQERPDIKKAIEEAKSLNEEFYFFNTICEEQTLEEKTSGKLKEYFISVKDAIEVKDVESTASSRMLEGYRPIYDSTVINRVKKEGGMIIGKTNHDEWGFGSFNVNVGLGKKIPLNPLDKDRCCGGSSGGCAGITKASKFKHISLGESTGGSIVCPACFCGLVGLCPTYGRVSRNGLMTYGNSLDKIGPIAKNVKDAALMMEVISGFDEKESTCADVEVDEYTKFIGKSIKGMRIGIIKEALGDGVDKRIVANMKEQIEELKNKGALFEEVSLPVTSKNALAVYYMVSTPEASTNLAKYCGMRYGRMEDASGKSFNDYFTEMRSKNFNDETKRRIILGTFARMVGFRDAFYIKAAKIRTLIIREYKEMFKRFDALISPTMPFIAPRFDEIKKMSPLQHYMADILLVGANVAGLPHITIPTGEVEGMPIGTMIIGDHFEEKKIIQIGSALEKEKA
jgi:aspartyl-tRNA(Asn)/glutamyl-tRNA(Gln) amidotransferase subunit A